MEKAKPSGIFRRLVVAGLCAAAFAAATAGERTSAGYEGTVNVVAGTSLRKPRAVTYSVTTEHGVEMSKPGWNVSVFAGAGVGLSVGCLRPEREGDWFLPLSVPAYATARVTFSPGKPVRPYVKAVAGYRGTFGYWSGRRAVYCASCDGRRREGGGFSWHDSRSDDLSLGAEGGVALPLTRRYSLTVGLGYEACVRVKPGRGSAGHEARCVVGFVF